MDWSHHLLRIQDSQGEIAWTVPKRASVSFGSYPLAGINWCQNRSTCRSTHFFPICYPGNYCYYYYFYSYSSTITWNPFSASLVMLHKLTWNAHVDFRPFHLLLSPKHNARDNKNTAEKSCSSFIREKTKDFI